jgi:probable rRNA maturation factor
MIETEVLNEGWPLGTDWNLLANNAVNAAVAQSAHAPVLTSAVIVEISVRLAQDADVQTLNKDYRDKDRPTNVLSFPMFEPGEIAQILSGREPMLILGDIILAQEVCVAEAAEKQISIHCHATHLIVHGVLHLLGYDHMGDADAEAMETLERKALASLGIADPYGD